MNSNGDDRKIAAYFNQLRQAELDRAPEFSSLLEVPIDTRSRYGLLHPSAGFAVALLALTILTVTLLRPGIDSSIPEPFGNPVDTIQLSSVDEMPTDFLLETPWPQLASLEPLELLLEPDYEILEEPPHEP